MKRIEVSRYECELAAQIADAKVVTERCSVALRAALDSAPDAACVDETIALREAMERETNLLASLGHLVAKTIMVQGL